MKNWNDSQKALLKHLCETLSAKKVYCSWDAKSEEAGMIKMMKKLLDRVELPIVWELTYKKKSSFFAAERLITECMATIFSQSEKGFAALENIENLEKFLYKADCRPPYPSISHILPKELELAAAGRDAAKLTFLLDVSDQEMWHRSQLLAFFVEKKDFEMITTMELYKDAQTLKDHRIFPLFFHVNEEKYPLFARALYDLLPPEKVFKKVVSCGLLPEKLPFFLEIGFSPQTLLYSAGDLKISLQDYYSFWQEIFPSAILLKGEDRDFDELLDHTRLLLTRFPAGGEA